MPRFTAENVGACTVVTDGSDGTTYTFASSWGDDFFCGLLLDLNVEELAEQEAYMSLCERGVEVG